MEIFLLLYIILFILALYNVKNAVFLFVCFIPIGDITDYQFLGLFGLNDVFQVILLYHIIRLRYLKYIFLTTKKEYQSLWFFLGIYVTIIFLNRIREDVLLQYYLDLNIDLMYFFKKSILFLLELINLIILVKIILLDEKMRKLTFFAMISSVLLLTISIFTADYLSSMGLNINVQGIGEDEVRNAGLYGGGDVNSLSTIFNIGICMIFINSFIKREMLKLQHILIITVLSIGVVFTGSRMGLIILVAVIVYYILFLQISHTKKHVVFSFNFIYILIAFIIVYYLIQVDERFQFVFSKIQDQGLTKEVSERGFRYVRWIRFINFCFTDTKRLLLGSNDIFYAFGGFIYKDPHNFFIRTLYLNGIILLSFFVVAFLKLVGLMKRNKLLLSFLLMVVVVIISFMIISQTVYVYYFIFFSAILLYSSNKNELVQKNTKEDAPVIKRYL